ncbi:MFS general substrate transporter [Mycena epipterygia]|nr:MFS general substrate transporter [Mycena epipterygia]
MASLKPLDPSDKPDIEQSEYAPKAAKELEWANRDDLVDIDKAPGVLGYFLKKNPSPDFVADVATMNETVLDPKEVARIERKIDWLIIPALSVCYMFYYVDKTTLSYAAIFDIKKDLHLAKSQYASTHSFNDILVADTSSELAIQSILLCARATSPWAILIFLEVGWVAWALPTNLLMQKFPLNKYLAFNIFLWGALLMAQAGSRNFTDLAILRTISGAAEATADPAFVLITSTWYTREQQPTRIGYWYCANGVGIGLGGLLGFAIGGLPSWKYEFLIIGAMCCAWAIFMFIFIPDSPYQTHWFTRAERLIIVSRKREDQSGTDNRHWSSSQALEAFMDIKTYLFFLFGFTANVPNGGTSNFGTLIVQGFGFSTFETTLMQIPYGTVIVLFIVAALVVNSKLPKGNRTWLMVATNIPTVVGFALIAWAKPRAARLAGYWMTGASNATFVVGLSLVSGNVGGQTKKAIASASVFLGVAAGNIVGPFLFKDSEAPTYITGVIACMVSRILEIFVILALRVVFSRANKKRDQAVAEGRVQYDERLTGLQDVSDWNNPAFRYVLVLMVIPPPVSNMRRTSADCTI